MPTIEYQPIAPGLQRARLVFTPEEEAEKTAREVALEKVHVVVELPPGCPPWQAALVEKVDALIALLMPPEEPA